MLDNNIYIYILYIYIYKLPHIYRVFFRLKTPQRPAAFMRSEKELKDRSFHEIKSQTAADRVAKLIKG